MRTICCFLIAAFWANTALPAAETPLMKRIRIATVTSSDLAAFEECYARWLGYVVRERGEISADQAAGWAAPAVAGRPYVLMSAEGAPDVFIRAIEAPAVDGYVPMTTWGWNSIEIIVDDPVELRKDFHDTPFEVIGEPKALSGYPTIVAFQVSGPDDEVLYLTAETGDRETSTLPLPNGDVGRVFIMVLAGPDIEQLLNWYANAFNAERGDAFKVPISVVQKAQGIAEDDLIWLGLIRMADHGNLIEFDGYSPASSGPRPFHAGELPPGIAMVSLEVDDLEALDLPYIREPALHAGTAYGGKRSATVRGPVGELLELIER